MVRSYSYNYSLFCVIIAFKEEYQAEAEAILLNIGVYMKFVSLNSLYSLIL